jgi:hypothetical protein
MSHVLYWVVKSNVIGGNMGNEHWSWSHSLKNYVLMFDLNASDFCQPLLDVAAGASTFNVEMTNQGYKVVSCDPIYKTSPENITQVINQLVEHLATKIEKTTDHYQWGLEYRNSADLIRQQHAMAEIFIRDYAKGLKEQRYISDSLPNLSFENFQFAYALCANFIFDGHYADDLKFQIAAIHDMARVAREVRIFPLLDPTGNISANLGPILAQLQVEGYGVEIRQVPYQLLKKGNAMLRVFAKNCPI